MAGSKPVSPADSTAHTSWDRGGKQHCSSSLTVLMLPHKLVRKTCLLSRGFGVMKEEGYAEQEGEGRCKTPDPCSAAAPWGKHLPHPVQALQMETNLPAEPWAQAPPDGCFLPWLHFWTCREVLCCSLLHHAAFWLFSRSEFMWDPQKVTGTFPGPQGPHCREPACGAM